MTSLPELDSFDLLLILKALGRSVFIFSILAVLIALLWYHTFITIIVIAVCWLAFMLYIDPPDEWS